MKRNIGVTMLVAAMLVAVPQVSLADHRGYGGHDGGGAPWWWLIPPLIYLSTLPAYRYPEPQPVIIQQPAPPTVIVQPPTMAPPYPQVAMPQAPQYWYYCAASNGYYPYVTACPSGWRPVPVMPPDVVQ